MVDKIYLKLSTNLLLASFIIFYLFFIYNSISSVLFYGILCIIIVTTFSDLKLDGLLLFSLGVIFSIIIYYYWRDLFGSPYYMGEFSDDWFYDVEWSKSYFDEYGINPSFLMEYFPLHNSIGYVYLIVILRKIGSYLGEYSTFLPRFLNLYFLLLISLFSYKLSEHFLFSREVGLKCFYAIFSLPVMLFNTVHVFRDTFSSLLIIMFFYYTLKIKEQKLYIISVIICLLLILTIRAQSFALLIALFPLIVYKSKQFVLYCVGILSLYLVVFLSYFNVDSLSILEKVSTYDSLNIERLGNLGKQIFSLPKEIGFIPRMAFMIFTPVPGLGSFHQAFTSINAFLQILFFPFLVLGLLNKSIDVRLKLIFMIYFISIAMSTATFRHVMMYLPIAAMIVIYQITLNGFKIDWAYIKLLSLLVITFVGSISLALCL